jgi:predicted transglutaminase-like cysteine proteinase
MFGVWKGIMVSQERFRGPKVILAMPLLLLLFVCLVMAQGGRSFITPELLDKAKQLYGGDIANKLQDWGELLDEAEQIKERDKLTKINGYFNQKINFISDKKHWKKEDYWATPLEALGSLGGDCEDYVIAKYFSLIQIGVDQKKLRITYVKALKLNQAHMVLAYYAQPRSDPLILDNINPSIMPASRRRDLAPVYSFNGLGMWVERMRGKSIKVGDPNRLNMWVDLLVRMEEQGLQSLLDIKVN